MQLDLQLGIPTGNLGAASSAAIDIAEQTPEQMQPLLLPAVMPLPGLAQQVIASRECQHNLTTSCVNGVLLWLIRCTTATPAR